MKTCTPICLPIRPVTATTGTNPYTNIKFANYSNDWGIDDTNAGDWCIMRAEEMLLIEAEAKAMAGDLAGAKALLVDWVKTYRNANYQSYASTAAEFQNEVWFQRRVELWERRIRILRPAAS